MPIVVFTQKIIAEFPDDGIRCMEKLQSHCANMTFADKSRYDRTQTPPRVMILMTLNHLRTVIIDIDDARIRNIGKRTRSDYAQL